MHSPISVSKQTRKPERCPRITAMFEYGINSTSELPVITTSPSLTTEEQARITACETNCPGYQEWVVQFFGMTKSFGGTCLRAVGINTAEADNINNLH